MDTAVVPAANRGAVVPAPSRLPASLGGGTVARAGNSASREMAKPAGGNVPTNLSVFSVLDMLDQQMHHLNTMLAQLGEQLVPLDKTVVAIDANATNVDEVCERYQAPAVTRSATDAASAVGAHMSEMSMQARAHAYRTQELNAMAFLALQAMREVQERQRAMGAGPELLRPAGR